LIARKRSPKRFWTQSRSRKREARKARVAPSDEAKETSSQAPDEAEDRAADERHHGGTRQRQPGHRHVGDEEDQRRLDRLRGPPRLDRCLLALEVVKAKKPSEIQPEVSQDQRGQRSQQQESSNVHGRAFLGC
jgi:hypothetical protein